MGLERQSGFMVFDVSMPFRPVFQRYYYYRDYSSTANGYTALGDVAPEGVSVLLALAFTWR